MMLEHLITWFFFNANLILILLIFITIDLSLHRPTREELGNLEAEVLCPWSL